MADELNIIQGTAIQLKNSAGTNIFPRIDLAVNNGNKLPVAMVDGVEAAISQAISQSQHLVKEIVEAKPTVENAKANVIYMVKRTAGVGAAAGDVYDEYMLIEAADGTKSIELLGNTEIDLSNYYTDEETDEAIKTAIEKVTGESTKTIAALDADKADKATTLDGYGITDAYTKLEVEGLIDGLKSADIEMSTGANLYTVEDTVDSAMGKLDAAIKGITDATDTSFTNYAVNGQKFSAAEGNNVVLDGADLLVTGYVAADAYSKISATDSINVALGKLEAGVVANKKSLDDKVEYTDFNITSEKLSLGNVVYYEVIEG
jgi:hypothetical protein